MSKLNTVIEFIPPNGNLNIHFLRNPSTFIQFTVPKYIKYHLNTNQLPKSQLLRPTPTIIHQKTFFRTIQPTPAFKNEPHFTEAYP